MNRYGITVSAQDLERVLSFPDGWAITHGEWDNDRALLKLYITGADMDVPSGFDGTWFFDRFAVCIGVEKPAK